jgi:hypothetical protein
MMRAYVKRVAIMALNTATATLAETNPYNHFPEVARMKSFIGVGLVVNC